MVAHELMGHCLIGFYQKRLKFGFERILGSVLCHPHPVLLWTTQKWAKEVTEDQISILILNKTGIKKNPANLNMIYITFLDVQQIYKNYNSYNSSMMIKQNCSNIITVNSLY